MLKQVRKSEHPDEASIGRYLNSPGILEDPRNHAVRIHDVLQVPDDDDKTLIVMDLLRKYNDPRFETVGEAVDFFSQVFEARTFIVVLVIESELLLGSAIPPRTSNCTSVYFVHCYTYPY
jgi:uncharacterized DUF497 family protein